MRKALSLSPVLVIEEQDGSDLAIGIESIFLEKALSGTGWFSPSVLRVNLANLLIVPHR